MAHSFFGGGAYSIIAPYMAEVWPKGSRASGMGLGYGVGNFPGRQNECLRVSQA